MKSLTPRILGIALLFALSFTYAFPWNAVGITPPFAQSNYKLGLDLNGGVELDYSVDVSAESLSGSTQRTNEVVEGLKSIIEKRVNSLGTAEPTIVTQSYGGEPHIVVQIPTLNLENESLTDAQKSQRNAEFIQKAKSVIGNVVQLEFKEKKTSITDTDKIERKKLAENFLQELTAAKNSFDVLAQKFKGNHENISYFSGSGTKSEIPNEVQSASFLAQKGASSGFAIEETVGGSSLSFDANGKSVLTEGNKGYLIYSVTAVTQRETEKITGTGAKLKKEMIKEPAYAYQALWISQQPSEWTIAKTASGQELDERYLQNANVSLNQVMQPQVELNFNTEGAKIFGELTGRLIGKQIAIFVGGEMLTAPTVNSVIPNGKAVITGNYSTEEAKSLANNINTGIVPAPIYLTSERTIDAKIGSDALSVIARAGIIGLLLVILFMVIVYRFCGLLSSIALVIYTFLILSILKFFGVVLTLSGIAGVILSIGLAIDANVLIFERMKEAIREGNGLARATLLGFEKSWTAIWDSHLTSITSAIVLFIFGVSLIKGFGLALLIGIALSLFTAMWVSRVLVLWVSRSMEGKEQFFLGVSKK